MLKFAKSVPYLPNLVRSRPFISEQDKEKAAAVPPQPVPFHCKPWVDGQTIGWVISYGYLTAVTLTSQAGQLIVHGGAQLAAETNQPRIVAQFAEGHLGIGTGYTLQTPPGFVSLILPAVHPPEGLEALTAVVETDWYPRQLFLVFRLPAEGQTIALDHGAELARVVVIPRQAAWEAVPLTEAELTAVQEREATYLAEEKTTPTSWTAATGDTFTHLYKNWARRKSEE